MARFFKLNENVFVNEVDKVSVAYSAFTNEMVVLHPITKIVLQLLQQPMAFSSLLSQIEKMNVQLDIDVELGEFVRLAVFELVLRGFVNEGELLNGTKEKSI